MTWLDDLFSKDKRQLARARTLVRDRQVDAALGVLAELDGPEADVLRHEARALGARRYLRRAVRACHGGDGEAMRQLLARARRYRTGDLAHLFVEADREIRAARLRHAIAEHWVGLLDVARAQRERFEDCGVLPERFAIFASPPLLRSARAVLAPSATEADGDALSSSDLEHLDRKELGRLYPLIRSQYPDDLARSITKLGPEFVRAVLLVAAARPDLAVLPLLELPESDPLVCFERARAAHLLDQTEPTMLALQSFATLNGGHRTIRRLNTGVFLAQVAVSRGDPERGIAALEAVPVRFLGKRPVMLYARLLTDSGRLDEASEVLTDHLSRTDNPEASALLDEVHRLRS